MQSNSRALLAWVLITSLLSSLGWGACPPAQQTQVVTVPLGTKRVQVTWRTPPLLNLPASFWDCDDVEHRLTYEKNYQFTVSAGDGNQVISRGGPVTVRPYSVAHDGTVGAHDPDPPLSTQSASVDVSAYTGSADRDLTISQSGCTALTEEYMGRPDPDNRFPHRPPATRYESYEIPVTVVPSEDDVIQLRLRTITPGGTDTEYFRSLSSAAIPINVALGTTFDISIVSRDESTGIVSPIRSLYSTTSNDVTPEADRNALFPRQNLLPFGDNVAAAAKAYQTIHLGTTEINILPFQSGLSSVDLEIHVVRPRALGTNEPSFDTGVVVVANAKGIPPQYIKGQMHQESGPQFRITNFRYEVCSWDLGIISTGQSLINDDPYNRYKLDDAIGTTLRVDDQDDLEPRTRLSIQDGQDRNGNPVYRPIRRDETNVTAQEIWEANDSINHPQNWTNARSPRCRNKQAILRDPTILNFTGQTPTASSYGLFQIMYGRAIDERWPGAFNDPNHPAAGDRNPKYLFDRPAYIEIGGGSTQIGVAIDVTNYSSFMHNHRPCDAFPVLAYPAFLHDADEYETFLKMAFQAYNCAHRANDGTPVYGPGVVNHAHHYLPTQTEQVFPQ